jgi:hypothetical protein
MRSFLICSKPDTKYSINFEAECIVGNFCGKKVLLSRIVEFVASLVLFGVGVEIGGVP